MRGPFMDSAIAEIARWATSALITPARDTSPPCRRRVDFVNCVVESFRHRTPGRCASTPGQSKAERGPEAMDHRTKWRRPRNGRHNPIQLLVGLVRRGFIHGVETNRGRPWSLYGWARVIAIALFDPNRWWLAWPTWCCLEWIQQYPGTRVTRARALPALIRNAAAVTGDPRRYVAR